MRHNKGGSDVTERSERVVGSRFHGVPGVPERSERDVDRVDEPFSF